MIRITKEFRFEAAHTLEGYEGLCSQVHGHSYRLLVTVAGEPCDDPRASHYGMVMDFGSLKKLVQKQILDRLDHALMMRDTPQARGLKLSEVFERVVLTPFQPTCENLIIDFVGRLSQGLPDGVHLHAVKLYETATSSAEWSL